MEARMFARVLAGTLTATTTAALAATIPHRATSHAWHRHHHRNGHHGLVGHQASILICHLLSFILAFFSLQDVREILEFMMNGSVLTIFILLPSCPLPHFPIKRLVGSLEGAK